VVEGGGFVTPPLLQTRHVEGGKPAMCFILLHVLFLYIYISAPLLNFFLSSPPFGIVFSFFFLA
jgi:hypothetical protein